MPQFGNFSLPASTATWTDSGIVLVDGDGIHFANGGRIQVTAAPHYAKPEGAYLTPDPVEYNPGGVILDASDIGVAGDPVCSNLPPFCCAILLLLDGEEPPEATSGSVDNAIRATQYVFYSNDSLKGIYEVSDVGGYRVWAIVNNPPDNFALSSGNIGVNLVTRNGPAADDTYATANIPETTWATSSV